MGDSNSLPKRHHRRVSVILDPQKPYSDLATTTFGPLEKYVAVNDNVPGAMPSLTEEDWARHAAETAFVPGAEQPARGPFERPPFTVFHGDNPHMEMTPEERLPIARQSG